MVVYDPSLQSNPSPDNIELYLIAEKRYATFAREIVREKLRKIKFGDMKDMYSAATDYAKCRDKIWYAHCWKCNRTKNSKDFSICGICGSLICICGECNCFYPEDNKALEADLLRSAPSCQECGGTGFEWGQFGAIMCPYCYGLGKKLD